MILICPACNKKYLIPDTAIGSAGRQVRCAACGHSWFQDGAALSAPPPPPVPPAPVEPPVPAHEEIAESAPEPQVTSETTPPPVKDSLFDHAHFQPLPSHLPARPAADGEVAESSVYGDDSDHDPYAAEPPFSRRRPTRHWTIAATFVSLLLIGGIVATYYLADPGVLARFGVPLGDADSPLVTQILSTDRGPKAGMTGVPNVQIHAQIINPTDKAQRVPDLLAELLDAHGRVIYSWTITPERRTIDAKGTLSIDSLEVGIPPNSDQVRLNTLRLKPS